MPSGAPPRSTLKLGAVKPLPSDAKFSGYSHVARGEIRRQSYLPLGLDEPGESNAMKYAVGAAVGSAVTWLLLRRE